MEQRKKIVVIGGGIAGLSAGIYGAMAGFKVHIYEKNPLPGGQCMGWNRKGHHIDNCIHWLTGTKKGTQLRQLWEDLGALEEDTAFVPQRAFYTSRLGSQQATLWRDLERTERELLALSPADRDEIQKFILHVKYAEACEMPVEKPMDMMSLGDYIRLGKSMANMPKVLREYGRISIRQLAGRFCHPLLRKLVSDYMPGDYPASSFLVSYATVVSGNGEVPKGGSLAMADRMAHRFRKLGGQLHLNCPIQKVIIQKGAATGILLKDGSTVSADYVISATDTWELFDRLLGQDRMPKVFRKAYENPADYPLFSGFQAAFSIDREALPLTGTVFFDCLPFQAATQSVTRMSVKSYEYEPGFAPEGKTVLQSNLIQFDADYHWWNTLDKEVYRREKKALATTVEEAIVSAFPSLRNHIVLLDCWTPCTYARYCSAYHGAYMSFITKAGMKSFQVKGTVPGLRNLFIASQWIMAPGGLPVAAASGRFAIQRILAREKRKG